MAPGLLSIGKDPVNVTDSVRDWAIATDGLSKRYRRVLAVDRLDLRVPYGHIYGFLGPNGAGKSTTLRLLLGLVRPSSGEAYVLGRRVRPADPTSRQHVGALVEEPAFVDYLSARRNLQMLLALTGDRDGAQIDEALALVGLTERQHDPVRTFSHGMKQRLGLAATLLSHPRLLILDEPANGLDPQGLVEIRQLLRRLREERGLTIFLSSHLLHEVQLLCDDVGIIHRGRLMATGPVTELLAQEKTPLIVELDDVARGAEIAAALPYVHELQQMPTGLRVWIEAGYAADLNTALVQAGLRVSALMPTPPALEDFYLQVVRSS